MANFDELNAEVTKLKAVVPSVIAVINGIAAQIDAAVAANDAGDNAALAGLSADVRDQADALAAAVATNTVAAAEGGEPAPTEPAPGETSGPGK